MVGILLFFMLLNLMLILPTPKKLGNYFLLLYLTDTYDVEVTVDPPFYAVFYNTFLMLDAARYHLIFLIFFRTNFNGGTCWLKSGRASKLDAVSTGNQEMVCGITISRT
jgi:hypothetical protein